MLRKLSMLGCAALLLVLTGCGNGTKQQIAEKAKSASTKEDLQKILGKPDNTSGMSGVAEAWTYKGSDGDVEFPIVAGKVGPAIMK